MSIYIAKADSVIRSARDEKIRRDFNGYNFKFLVNKYNLSERTIRKDNG
ncbi:Mor transcription activator family protein [Ruminococcus sp.]